MLRYAPTGVGTIGEGGGGGGGVEMVYQLWALHNDTTEI